MKIKEAKKNWYLLIALLALPILLFAVTRGEGRPLYNPSTKAATTELLSYKSSSNAKYSFQFPAEYKLQEISDRYTAILNGSESLVEITIETDLGDYANNVSEFSINRYKVMHEIEWKDQQTKKELKNSVVNSRSYAFINPHGIKGYEIYLTIESKDRGTGYVEERGEVGPLFAFDISQKNPATPVIFAHGYGDSKPEKVEILRTIANTLLYE